jgi:hypothetical protein
MAERGTVQIGPGCIVALQYRSSTVELFTRFTKRFGASFAKVTTTESQVQTAAVDFEMPTGPEATQVATPRSDEFASVRRRPPSPPRPLAPPSEH